MKNTDISVLRLITCGSVDDGKSTLIGQMLFQLKLVFDDQLAALQTDSRKFGTQGSAMDFALLLDELASEREQGITIDVAYRYINTGRRSLIIADTPGHEEYTRNMATGASTAALAIVIVDAQRGVLTQTRRHAFIASLFGIENVVLAVNKMDLVGYDEDVFANIASEFMAVNKQLKFKQVRPIPISALMGDNVVKASSQMLWYKGPTLLDYLEKVDVSYPNLAPLRLPVQHVIRPDQNFHGYAGRIVGGSLSVGDIVKILPSNQEAKISQIYVGQTEQDRAHVGQSVTLTLTGEFSISRGDMLVDCAKPAEIADQFQAMILWMDQTEMLPGRKYIMKTECRSVIATLAKPRYRINVNNYEKQPCNTLALNDIASCNISLDRDIAFDAYDQNRTTGSFILIDPSTNATVGAGIIRFALRRNHNIYWHAMDVTKTGRARAKGQKPFVLWFTGLSGSGKSTIANVLEQKLYTMGLHTMLLDGDNVRHGLNRDLGFTNADRVENIRRVGEVSKLMLEGGLITLVSFISPFSAERDMVRNMFKADEFIEIYVNTPIEEAEKRDTKELYQKARAGKLKNFTGIDSPYEPPLKPEVNVSTLELSAEEAAEKILNFLKITHLN